MSEALDKQIPLAAFQEMVAQYHHRLLSLEADLKDQARTGKLSPSVFAKRVRRLKKIHKSLGLLQQLCLAETPDKLTAADIGLPVLSECTPAEREIIERFLGLKEQNLRLLEAETGRVYGWLLDAISGRANPIRMILRLSKLRRFIQSLEKQAAMLDEESSSLALPIDKLLAETRAQHESGGGYLTTLDGLMTLFQQLDSTIGRVARLRATVKKEELRTKAMEDWLRREEQSLKEQRPASMQPTPLALMRAAQEVRAAVAPTLRESRRRRELVEQFLDEVVFGGARPVRTADVQAAAALLERETHQAAALDRDPGRTNLPGSEGGA